MPILDTTLVTLKRLAERRPVTQGGRDHTSHRLVYYGLSEAKAVLLLALVAAAIGATALAYNVLDNGRLTALGVLVTFVLLVQFGSFLSDLEERSRRGASRGPSRRSGGRSSSSRAGSSRSSSTSSSSAARSSPPTSSSSEAPARSTSARCSSPRSRSCSPRATSSSSRSASTGGCGASRRRATSSRSRSAASASAVVAYVVLVALRPIGSFPAVEIFVVDAVLATVLVGASRLTLRLLPELQGHRRHRGACSSSAPGAAGRGLARELRESQEARVVGFLDDNPRVRRRRILGITVVGSTDEAERAIASTRAEEVLVTIPDAPPERLDAVLRASEDGGRPVPDRPPAHRVLGTRAGRGVAHVSHAARRRGRRASTSSPASSRRRRSSPSTSRCAALYAWQASRHPVPTIFTDELELTQLSRAIAETGEPARRGSRTGSRRSSPTSSRPGGGSRRRRPRTRRRSSCSSSR